MARSFSSLFGSDGRYYPMLKDGTRIDPDTGRPVESNGFGGGGPVRTGKTYVVSTPASETTIDLAGKRASWVITDELSSYKPDPELERELMKKFAEATIDPSVIAAGSISGAKVSTTASTWPTGGLAKGGIWTPPDEETQRRKDAAKKAAVEQAATRNGQMLQTLLEIAKEAPELLGRRAVERKDYTGGRWGLPNLFEQREDLIEVLHKADFRRDYAQHAVVYQDKIEKLADTWSEALHAELIDCVFLTGPRAVQRKKDEADRARAVAEARQENLDAIAAELTNDTAGSW